MKPERDHNNRALRKKNWCLFGEPVGKLRTALRGLRRYIATVETSKFKPFIFIEPDVIPDHKLYAIACDDAFVAGVLSSRIHGVWAPNAGGTLEDRPTWTNTTCFRPFPFPAATEAQQTCIRELAERLDAHRKRQQAQHPKLTLTDLYNVLEKLRANQGRALSQAPSEPEAQPESGRSATVGGSAVGNRRSLELTAKERIIHEHGLVTVLRQLHDDLDAAVAEAYAIPPTASDDAILTHLCALNAQRAAEERTGQIRWLRPAFQRMKDEGGRMKTEQGALAIPDAAPLHPSSLIPHPSAKWPKSFAEQALAVRTALTTFAAPADAAMLAKTFKGAKADRIEDILETLASLGQARALCGERYVAA